MVSPPRYFPSAGLRGARFQANFAKSSYVEIGWNLWGMLPHLVPQRIASVAFAHGHRNGTTSTL